MTIAPGTQLGGYEIRSLLGKGGMGEVYRALDTRLGREVAIKVLPAAFSANADRRRRFEQEARAASALNHPNIITIHEIGQIEGAYYIVTEFIAGQTLRQRVILEKLSLREAIDVAMQCAAALSAAHLAGIIHRDIKPENVMIRPDGLVKVLDFGLAKLDEHQLFSADSEAPTSTGHETDPGTIMGTAAYMSPEQSRGQRVDARTDLFSLGVVLYEMLVGQSPFKGPSMADIFAAILVKEPPPLAPHLLEVAPELEQVVRKCLEKERERRYQSAAELIADLKNLTAERSQRQPAIKLMPSIAVLPFANMSPDRENEYFCDGLAEELLNALAKIEGLKVAARTSSFSFKGKDAKMSEIGETLKVSAVLEGSVRRAGQRLRIMVQLINVSDGYQLWSERYDRQMEDIFDVQDEITLAVVAALKVKLLGEAKAAVLKRYTDNPEAYEFYLKGRYHSNKYTGEGWQKGMEYFEKAIEKEPEYAQAHAGLALCRSGLWYFGFLPPHEIVPSWKAAANRALELDGDLADAHFALAILHFYYEWNWPEAEREFQRAIKLNPNSADAHYYYGGFLAAMQRFDQAIHEGRRALELDPLSLFGNIQTGWIYWLADRFDEALEQTRKIIEIEPRFYGAYWLMGAVYVVQGRYAEATEAYQKAFALSGDQMMLSQLGSAYVFEGRRDEALQTLNQLLDLSQHQYISAFNIARVYSDLGEKDLAFEWLEKAYAERNGEIVFLKLETKAGPRDGFWKSICADLRFRDLLRRIGLPE